MKIVIAPDSFKESADAVTVAAAIARGIARVRPDARLDACPMADGGQGTVAAMVAATGGTTRRVRVTGPLGEPVQADFGLLGDGPDRPTAVVEMAAASGLMLVPRDRRNPMLTTTYGTGELIRAALDAGAGKVIVGIGGSATNDCGAGMAQALGYRFFDLDGRELPPGLGGGQLGRVARVDASRRDTRLDAAEIVAACDVNNPLTGASGASSVYGPQKGATPDMVRQLDDNLSHFASLLDCYLRVQITELAGAGAAGGLGGGLVAFANARLQPGIQIVIEATRLADRLRGADLCITGEGKLDSQSLSGKTAIGVGRLARELGVPAIAIVGSAVEPGATQATHDCLAGYYVTRPPDMPLDEAMARAAELIEQAAEQAARERLI